MAFVYCAVGKYPDIILCESMKRGMEEPKRLAQMKMKEVYREQHQIPLNEEFSLFCLKMISDNGALFFCVCNEKHIYLEKVYRFLDELRNSFFYEFFDGSPERFPKKGNFESLYYQKQFGAKLQKIVNIHDTGISMQPVKIANEKIDKTKTVLHGAIKKQLDMNDNMFTLREESEKMKELSKGILKDTEQFKDNIYRRSFWWFSKPCLWIFGLPLGLVLIYIAATFVICGNFTLAVGCRNA